MKTSSIVIGVTLMVMSITISACERDAIQQYESIYESEVTIEQLYKDINKADTNWMMEEIRSIQTITDYNGAELNKENYLLKDPPLPSIGVRVHQEQGGEFIEPEDKIDLYTPLELVVKADPEFASDYPKEARYRIERLRVVISRPGLIPLEKEYSHQELLSHLDLRNQEKGEFIYLIDPFDISYNPTGYMMRIEVKAVTRLDVDGNRIAVNSNQLNNEFAFHLAQREQAPLMP
ncbi:MAG: hypothetical protein ACQETE_08725 [Bacteroidota bacterium]